MEESYSPLTVVNDTLISHSHKEAENSGPVSNVRYIMGGKESKDEKGGKLPEGEVRGPSSSDNIKDKESSIEAKTGNRNCDVFVLNIKEEIGKSACGTREEEMWSNGDEEDDSFTKAMSQDQHNLNRSHGDNFKETVNELNFREEKLHNLNSDYVVVNDINNRGENFTDPMTYVKKDIESYGKKGPCNSECISDPLDDFTDTTPHRGPCNNCQKEDQIQELCSCSKQADVFKDNNNHTDSTTPCGTCSQERGTVQSPADTKGLDSQSTAQTLQHQSCSACVLNQQNNAKIHEPYRGSAGLEPVSGSQTCSQCGENSTALTSVFDASFCEKCYREFEMNVSVACSVENNRSEKTGSQEIPEKVDSYEIPETGSWQKMESQDSHLIDRPLPGLDYDSENFQDLGNNAIYENSGFGYVKSVDSLQTNQEDEYEPKEAPSTEHFGRHGEHVENSLQGNDIREEDLQVSGESVDEEEVFDNVDVFDDTLEASTVIQTSDCVHWEGGVMCTCEECLKGLRIERIVTADKSTMCPEDPPYVLMCEICEELLENQLQKTEKDIKKKEDKYKWEIKELKTENEAAQKIINQNLQLGPEAKIEATMQHEITRLTSENLDLREKADKQADQIRKMKKMLKVYAKKLKDGDVAEIEAELEKDDKQKKTEDNVATVKHLDRTYMGMLEYKKEDEGRLIKCLIMDLKPKVAQGLLPGLPAYILFMCVRHTDYINDDEKVRTLLTNTINGIKKCVKKHNKELERVILWLANTCRLLHTLKQYSGEKTFQSENTSRQNEHCLRNFDLSEYRQVFSDLAVWIFQTMIKYMEEVIQPMVVPAVLEHEAIAGLSASKPSGMRGRSSSTQDEDVRELSLDTLMKSLNKYNQVLSQHAVDPELVKQVFRQLYYYIGSNALNNLLLRKDMCNWSKGMQIRYNLSHLEQWLRDNKLNESGAQSTLEPITQASQLLQARKSEADVDSICEMCSKLTTAQIVKILNLYTPVDEFEERVPISFIRKIQERLKSTKKEEDNTLLIDTKYSFPVTFPFNPSSLTLDSIDVPEALHLDFLTRV